MKTQIPEILIQIAQKPHLCRNCSQSVLSYLTEPRKKELLAGTLRFPFCPHCLKFFIPEELPPEIVLETLVRQFNESYADQDQEAFFNTRLRLEIVRHENNQVEIVRHKTEGETLSGKLNLREAIAWLDGYRTAFRINVKMRSGKLSSQASPAISG